LAVKTALVEERPVARYVEVVGSLKADQEVVVSSEVKGIIEELQVDLGSVVRRGQLLARLAQREAQLRIDQAQAALDQARARVGMRNGSSSLEAAQNSEVRQAKAALDEARLRYERAKTLIKNGDISQERFDEAEIQHRAVEARYGRHKTAFITRRRSSSNEPQSCSWLASSFKTPLSWHLSTGPSAPGT
jgi:multidrug resistance efflux pump